MAGKLSHKELVAVTRAVMGGMEALRTPDYHADSKTVGALMKKGYFDRNGVSAKGRELVQSLGPSAPMSNPRRARLWPIYQVGGSASRTFATKRAARTWKRRYGGRIEEMRSMMGPHRETFNPRRGRRVPGMLRAPKWGLYRAGGRKRRYNPSRGEMLRAGTHRARRHALGAIRAGDPRTAQRYLGLEERLMARRRALGLNRGIRRNRKRPGPKAYRRGFVMGRFPYAPSTSEDVRLASGTRRIFVAGYERGLARHLEATSPRHRQYNKRGGRRWIQGAVRRPGALRAKLMAGYVPGARLKAGQKIPETLLERAYSRARATGDTQTMRQVNLARRFLGMARSRRRGRRAYRKVAN